MHVNRTVAWSKSANALLFTVSLGVMVTSLSATQTAHHFIIGGLVQIFSGFQVQSRQRLRKQPLLPAQGLSASAVHLRFSPVHHIPTSSNYATPWDLTK